MADVRSSTGLQGTYWKSRWVRSLSESLAVIRTTGSESPNRSIIAGTATHSGWSFPRPTALALTMGAEWSMSRKFFGARLQPEPSETVDAASNHPRNPARFTARPPSLEVWSQPCRPDREPFRVPRGR